MYLHLATHTHKKHWNEQIWPCWVNVSCCSLNCVTGSSKMHFTLFCRVRFFFNSQTRTTKIKGKTWVKFGYFAIHARGALNCCKCRENMPFAPILAFSRLFPFPRFMSRKIIKEIFSIHLFISFQHSFNDLNRCTLQQVLCKKFIAIWI